MTTTTDILLCRLRAAGGRLVLCDRGLKVRAPAPLPDALVAALRSRKAELMAAILSDDRRSAVDVDGVRAAIHALTTPDLRRCPTCGGFAYRQHRGRRVCARCWASTRPTT